MNKVLFDKIQNKFREKGYKFEVKDENKGLLHLIVKIDNVIGNVSVFIQILDRAILSYASLNNKVPAEYINSVSEYLHRANYSLLYGNFEMDYDDGKVMYKLVTDCYDVGTLPNAYFNRCILLPCQMFEKYGEGIIKLTLGVGNPKSIIDEIEKND